VVCVTAEAPPLVAEAAPDRVPAWVYRLDVEPPARHESWRRAIRILRVRRSPAARRVRRG
jgi:hypothetical protein